MRVLIVEENADLGTLWADHLRRQGHDCELVGTAEAAMDTLRRQPPAVILADLDLPDGAAMAVADYAAYRAPAAKVIFVTASSFFSGGSVFAQSPNACAFLPASTAPDDLAAIVDYHGRARRSGR